MKLSRREIITTIVSLFVCKKIKNKGDNICQMILK